MKIRWVLKTKHYNQTSSYIVQKLRWQMRFPLTNLSVIFNLSFHLNVKLTFSPTGFLIFPLSRNFTFKPILPTPKWMLATRKHRVKFAFKFKCCSNVTRALGLFKPWNIFSVRLQCHCIRRIYWNAENEIKISSIPPLVPKNFDEIIVTWNFIPTMNNFLLSQNSVF